MNNENVITELQMKIAFLEDAVEKLSIEFYQQQNDLVVLKRNNQQLQEKLTTIENYSESSEMSADIEKPPHY